MIKILAYILIIAGSTAVGLMKAGELKKRYDFLDIAISSVKIMENNIENSNMDMNELLDRLNRIECFSDIRFYKDIKKYLNEKHTLDESVSIAAKTAAEQYYLSSEDKRILESVKEIFRSQDTGEAIINCKRCEEMFCISRQGASNRIKTHGRLYPTFGVLAGIMVVIMLI